MKLILVRHGESQWNKENRFTGWVDVDLSETGVKEAVRAGELIREAGLTPRVAHTSRLKRAVLTLNHILNVIDRDWLDIKKTWRLNERHYGALQGLNKAETAEKHGEEQVKIWRRSYSTPPPMITVDDPRHPRHPRHDPRYSSVPLSDLPSGESLAMTVARLLPYWKEELRTDLLKHGDVLVVAHGNSLRALVKELDQMSESDILELNIPTGIPLVYELNNKFEVVNKKYLGDESLAKAAQDAVAQQGKAKK